MVEDVSTEASLRRHGEHMKIERNSGPVDSRPTAGCWTAFAAGRACLFPNQFVHAVIGIEVWVFDEIVASARVPRPDLEKGQTWPLILQKQIKEAPSS